MIWTRLIHQICKTLREFSFFRKCNGWMLLASLWNESYQSRTATVWSHKTCLLNRHDSPGSKNNEQCPEHTTALRKFHSTNSSKLSASSNSAFILAARTSNSDIFICWTRFLLVVFFPRHTPGMFGSTSGGLEALSSAEMLKEPTEKDMEPRGALRDPSVFRITSGVWRRSKPNRVCLSWGEEERAGLGLSKDLSPILRRL